MTNRAPFDKGLRAQPLMRFRFQPNRSARRAQSGRGPDELLQDALAGYFDELVQTGDMLNNRYDELKSGRVKPIDGEEAFARLKAKTQAQRKQPA